MTRTNRTRRLPRAAFTLVELLVVIGIIALLVSLSTAAYQRVRVSQMVRTTEDVVSKVQMGLDGQVKIIADKVRQEQLNESDDFKNLRDDFCAPADKDLAVAVLLYCRLRQNFPQTAAELSSPSFTLGTTKPVTFRRPLAFNTIASATGTPEQVSAAVLFAALAGQTQGGNTFAADEALSGAQIDIPLGSVTARVFKDGWGNPIAFNRFFQSAELDAPPFCDGKFGTGAAAGKDPFDSWGKIYSWTGANKATLQSTLGVPAWGRNTNVVAYSWGLDKTPNTADDILGYRLRAIATKGGPKQ